MNFVSSTFVVFLILVFTLYWSIRSRVWQNRLLLISSYIFYGWWDWRFCGLLLFTCLVDYYIAQAVDRTQDPRRRKQLLCISLVSNLGILGVFKYYNFFQESFVSLAGDLGWHVSPFALNVILPVGISFYTFQSLSYTIDVYRRKLPVVHSVVDYLAYVSFFPQLVAGPIERATHLLPQFALPRRFDHAMARDGCRQMLWGFAKKIIVADNLAQHVDAAFGQPDRLRGITLLLMAVFFAFQIYCDFSAYSDIALGTARLFGFDFNDNFRYPYFSTSPIEFWRRWHISLSTWFRDYVYIPLGGNRAGPIRHLLNLLITFTISGLWHGAAATFVVWGVFHGVIVVINHLLLWAWEKSRFASDPERPPSGILVVLGLIFGNILTFTLVTIGFVFFRADSVKSGRHFLQAIYERPFTTRKGHLVDKLNYDFNQPISLMVWIILIMVVVEFLQRGRRHPLRVEHLSRPVRWLIYTFLIWCILYFYEGKTMDFIYFQF